MIPRPEMVPGGLLRVPRTRGDDPRGIRVRDGRERVFPAHAGMIPAPEFPRLLLLGVPRTRGDDPVDGVRVAV